MINKNYFQGKIVCVIGLARSGLASANLLHGLGAKVRVTDSQDTPLIRENALKLESDKILFELGRHTEEFIKGADLVVVSPGVPDSSQAIVWARGQGVPLISEIEAASILCPATLIAVTGSNGKTTVTTLIGKILEASKKTVHVCGNIGNPFSGVLAGMKEGDFVVLEISSFQLEKIKTFKPKISLILNFTRNHLDRHKDMQEYLGAKKRIFMNQDKSDFALLNSDDATLKALAKDIKAKVIYFSKEEGLNPNQAAVMKVGEILGISKSLCLDVFKKFPGVEHRMEKVAEINSIKFINDSKSTTVESTIWALENINSSVILIAGGKDKGLDYTTIRDVVRKKVKTAVLIGQAKEKIRQAFEGVVPIDEAGSLEDAVKISFQKASSGDSVLLSPMCASFDMFVDYEDRGRKFKNIVRDLASKNK